MLPAFSEAANRKRQFEFADDERFCPYIDIPLQHISDPMLKAMARGVTKQQTVHLMDLIAKKRKQTDTKKFKFFFSCRHTVLDNPIARRT